LLLHGFLTPQLLLKDVLQSNLLVIKLHLKTYFPIFHLIFDKARSFYAMHDFLFGRHGRHLLIQIQIRIPVTTFYHEFTAYKVSTFPVLVTGRSSHSTSLLDGPNYFVTSRQSPFHFDMQRRACRICLPLLLFPATKGSVQQPDNFHFYSFGKTQLKFSILEKATYVTNIRKKHSNLISVASYDHGEHTTVNAF